MRRKKAFTLIELLVVIAIIAILAAILFPVFAQAKRAAKGAVAVSGAKQMALGQIMYTNDYDDYFSPIAEFLAPSAETGTLSGAVVLPFSYLQQPYMKSWSVLLDPTGPIVQDQLVGDANGGYDLEIYGEWGMPPERIASHSTSASDWTLGQQPVGAQFTGGRQFFYDGVAGVANATPQGNNWLSGGYVVGNVPSLTTTAVANPSDQVLIAQSGTWDFMWEFTGFGTYGNGNDTPDNFDLYYSSCANTYGCNAVICGPVARQRDSDGPSVGFFPYYIGGVTGSYNSSGAAAAPLPTGLTAWAGTDGHVKASPWRSLMGSTINIANGQVAIKAFWPSGS